MDYLQEGDGKRLLADWIKRRGRFGIILCKFKMVISASQMFLFRGRYPVLCQKLVRSKGLGPDMLSYSALALPWKPGSKMSLSRFWKLFLKIAKAFLLRNLYFSVPSLNGYHSLLPYLYIFTRFLSLMQSRDCLPTS